MDAYTQQGKHQFLCLILLNMSTSVSADCLCEDVAMNVSCLLCKSANSAIVYPWSKNMESKVGMISHRPVKTKTSLWDIGTCKQIISYSNSTSSVVLIKLHMYTIT
jgi:hypothetical protein